MSHRPLYRKPSHHVLRWLVLTVLVIAGIYFSYQHWGVFNPQKLVEASQLKSKNFEVRAQEITSPKYGIKAYLFEDKTNPIVSISFLFKNAGYASDNSHEQGIANMTASLLTEGAGNLKNQDFKEELANLAIQIGFNAGKDDFSGSLLTTKENQKRAFELLKLVLSQPRFDEEDIILAKAQMIEALKRQKEHPAGRLGLEFNKELYGNHPYSRNPLGEAEDILKINHEKLASFVKDNLSRQNVIVGIAGDITPQEAVLMLDDVFGVLPEIGRINFVRDTELKFDGRTKLIEQKTGQNIAMKAAGGVSRNHEDFYPLFVANHILGGSGLSSRLSQEIREKKGLTYGVYSYLTLDDKSPLIAASFSTTAANYQEAEKLFIEQWQKFGEQGATQKELNKAKDYLIASYNLRFASIDNIADILTAMQKYNLGLDFLQKRNEYVQNVNLTQVNQAAKKYFNKEKLIDVSIGSFRETKEK